MRLHLLTLCAICIVCVLAASCTDFGSEPPLLPAFNLSDFPYQLGNSWTYAVHDSLRNALDTLQINVVGRIPNMSVWIWREVRDTLVEIEYCSFSRDTMKISSHFDGHWPRSTFVFPIEVGKKWTGSSITHGSVVIQYGPVTVPGGEYANAFLVKETYGDYNAMVEISCWMVPHVGIVWLHWQETNFGVTTKNLSWELLVFNSGQQ